MNPAWWTRLCDAVGALLRHPYKRVTVDLPAYAGWGPTGIPPAPEPRPDLGRYERAMDQHRQHWPDDGEAIHGPLNERTLTYADGTEHLTHLAFATRGMPCACEAVARSHQQRRETPEEAARRRNNSGGPLVHDSTSSDGQTRTQVYWSGGLMAQRPEMLGVIRTGRPAPAENARRYSVEDGTW